MMMFFLACSSWNPWAEAGPPRLELYFVRHAEKDTTIEKDPPLTPAGEARAEALAERLSAVELDGIHSTDTLRTRSTAAPTARMQGVALQIYDGREPETFLKSLAEEGGVHLVVGHSNTVPDLVAHFGGSPGEPIQEKTEYDRLYRVVNRADGEPVSSLTRYGVPSP